MSSPVCQHALEQVPVVVDRAVRATELHQPLLVVRPHLAQRRPGSLLRLHLARHDGPVLGARPFSFTLGKRPSFRLLPSCCMVHVLVRVPITTKKPGVESSLTIRCPLSWGLNLATYESDNLGMAALP